MKVVIMGCGRVGSALAIKLDEENHEVTIMDLRAHQFERFLPESFGGRKIAGIEEADAFIALTQGDNRNITAAQVAKHIFGVERVVCRIKDPIREEMYNELGLQTVSPTRTGLREVSEVLGA